MRRIPQGKWRWFVVTEPPYDLVNVVMRRRHPLTTLWARQALTLAKLFTPPDHVGKVTLALRALHFAAVRDAQTRMAHFKSVA